MSKLPVYLVAVLGCCLLSFSVHAGPKKSHHYNVGHYLVPGYKVVKLPKKHHSFVYKKRHHAYFGGHYFVKHRHGYQVVSAPLGVRVAILPPGYVSFWLGKRRYFYVNHTYYLWSDRHRDYEVVSEPPGAEDALLRSAAVSSEIYAYPARGQSERRQDRDYYDCHVWAAGQAGYDPSLEYQDVHKAKNYRRAMSACLEGRGYSVK
ncbi:MAG: DUF6515 family protein [Pseudomonadota bacterium]